MSDFDNLGDRLLVIFDGHCGLCNRSIRWLIARDRRDRLRFIPSDSPKIAPLLNRGRLETGTASGPGTILVVENRGQASERIFSHSTAVLALLRQLPAAWPAIAAILKLIPRPLRDLGYRVIARFRYRIWGRLAVCPLPTRSERERFL